MNGILKKAISNDPVYMRIKDIVLIMLALSSLYGMFVKPALFSADYEQHKLMQIRMENKYIPVLERHDIEIAVIRTQLQANYAEIMRELKSINVKLNR